MTLFLVSNLIERATVLPAGRGDSRDSEMFIVSYQGKICYLPSHSSGILKEKGKKVGCLEAV